MLNFDVNKKKLSSRKTFTLPYECLMVGSAFFYGGLYYLKTEEDDLAVNLERGQLDVFYGDEEVTPLYLVVKER